MPTTTKSTKSRAKSPSSADIYGNVTSRIMAALEAGVVPWRRPWDPGTGQPISLSSGKPYRGVNVLLLGLEAQLQGYVSPFWGTYRELSKRGGQVRRGQHPTSITFWKKLTKEVLNEKTGELEIRTFPMLRSFSVFNSDQADTIPEGKVNKWGETATGVFDLPHTTRAPFEPIERAEEIFSGYFEREGSPTLVTGNDGRACYSPSLDTVSLPPRQSFHSAEGWYSTGFHEATHSTGHKNRLGREGVLEGHPFGSSMYAAEELVAEMGAALLAGHAGIENETIPASAAYLESWLKALKNDRKLLVGAAGKAQRAVDHILGVESVESDTQDVAAGSAPVEVPA